MKYLTKILKRRKQIAKLYLNGLKGIVGLPVVREDRVWQDFVIDVGKDRDKLFDYLKKNGIETMKNEYHMPIQKLPQSIQYEKDTLRIPINEVLKDSEINQVIKVIKKFYEGKR